MPEDKEFLDGEILTAERLNAMRTALSQRIDTHDHTGGSKGPKLGGASIQDLAVATSHLKDASVTQAKLDPALFKTLKDGPTTSAFMKVITKKIGGMLVDGLAEGVQGVQGVLAEGVQGLAAETKGLRFAEVEKAAAEVKGAAEIDASAILEPIEIIVNPRYTPEWTITGANVSAVYRQQSQGNSTSDPSVIHIEFAKAYTSSAYTVMITPEYTATAKVLFVVKRDPKYVELTVQTGKYADLKVGFSLVIFGDLTP